MMLDSFVRPTIDRCYGRIMPVVAALPLSANAVTLAGALLIPAVVVCIATGHFALALALVAANRFLDGLDGALARWHGATDFGGYADIVADFLFYASIPLAFALYNPEGNAVASCFLLASFIGTGSSFLAYAILAAKQGKTTATRGTKSFFHLGGFIEGSETIAFFVIVCLLPQDYALIATVFATLCLCSTFGRIVVTYRDFGQ